MREQEANATAILLAGGSGSRMRGVVSDKVLHPINGKPVWKYSFDAFVESGCIQNYIFVCRDEVQHADIQANLPPTKGREDRPGPPSIAFILGGKERQDSVWAGLQSTSQDTDIVLIHDLARPLIAPETIKAAVAATIKNGIACVVRKTTDTIKRSKAQGDAHILETIDRSNLWSMETPQCFRYSLIKDAYQQVIESETTITDDLSAVESDRLPVVFIENDRPNHKLTTEHDLAYMEFLLKS